MANTNNAPRLVYNQMFDPKGHTNENSLAAARLTAPDKINRTLTYLQGKDSANFPLTFLTEGQKNGNMGIGINDIQYTWDFIEQMDKADEVMSSNYTAADEPGKNFTEVSVVFKTNWLVQQHTIVAEDGTRARIAAAPVKVSNGWLYKLVISGSDPNASIPPYLLQQDAKWIMEGPGTVSESLSWGNKSNVTAPGKLTNQISVLRKSYHIGGNISNKVVECYLPTKSGGSTKLWMPFEEYQHELNWKRHCEEHLWWSHYNRDAQGRITATDQETGLPIPIGAGLVDQIPHRDTYASLTASKLDTTVLSVMYGRNDGVGARDIVLYTGIGGAREFDRAMKQEVAGVSQIIGDKFVQGEGMSLVYGGYFNAYKTQEGNRIIVKLLDILDRGSRAKVSPVHPVTNLPMTSYNMFFVDQTVYDGVPNIRMVHQNGRSFIRGVEQGMALYKGSSYADYSGNANLALATSQDKTSIHFLSTKGVLLNRNSHCFWLQPDMSQAS
jgi:hypothetical protein